METLIFKELIVDSTGIPKKVLACSYSQIEVFLQCAYKWYNTYLIGNRVEEKSEALALGSAVHITLQEYMDALKDGKHWELGEALDLLDINMDVQDIPFSTEESKDIATEQHRNMIAGLVEKNSALYDLVSQCEIVACEKEFVYQIELPFDIVYKGESYGCVYVIGSIDLLLKDTDGNLIVVDYKSGNKKFDNTKIKNNLQLPIYSLVVQRVYGRLPSKLLYYFTRLDELQEVQPIADSYENAKVTYYKNGREKSRQRCVQDIMNILQDIFKQMYASKKYKANVTPLCCWCQFQHNYGDIGTCKYGFPNYWRKDIDVKRY